MLYTDYVNALKSLPVNNPVITDFKAICPHLSKKQIEKVFRFAEQENAEGKTGLYFALPPTKVRHGYLVAGCSHGYESEGEVYPPRLRIAFARRTLESYADGQPHGDISSETNFQDSAMAYAEKHWPKQLIVDSWVDVGNFFLDNPTKLDGSLYPKRVAEIFWTTNRPWHDIIKDYSAPQSQIIDKALMEITMDKIEAMEMKGGRGGFTRYNCGHCSNDLGISGCGNCGHTFRDNGVRSGHGAPLSSKVVNLLIESGYEFAMDPEIARKKEASPASA